MLICETEHLEVHFVDRRGDTVLITFNEMGMRADGKRFWADNLAEKLGISIVGFVSRFPNWFPARDVIQAIKVMDDHLPSSLTNRICYGLSQGGYAVLRYQTELRATVVAAFSPQASIAQDDILDHRFNHFYIEHLHDNMLPRPNCGSRPTYVFYDPEIKLDAEHVGILRQILPFKEYRLRFFGHSSAACFAKTELMSKLLAGFKADCDTSIDSVCREARRQASARPYLICHAIHQRWPKLTLGIFRKYRSLRPADSWWTVARLLALQGYGWEVMGWLLEECFLNPANAELLACTAMSAIELSDKVIASRFIQMALKLEPCNETFKWIENQVSNI